MSEIQTIPLRDTAYINEIIDSDKLSEEEKVLFSQQALSLYSNNLGIENPEAYAKELSDFDAEYGSAMEGLVQDWTASKDIEDVSILRETVAKRYLINMTEGKWRYRGYVTFFGNRDSGIHRVAFGSHNEAGAPQALRIICNSWHNLPNSACKIIRYHDGGFGWQYKEVVFNGWLIGGKGGNSRYQVSVG